METITQSAQETKDLGQTIAISLKSQVKTDNQATVFALSGDLGSGKTTFVQGFAQGLGLGSEIISPTFILVRRYELKSENIPYKYLYHIDLYRLDVNIKEELVNLGVDEVWKDPENIVLIEWAEKAKEVIPDYAKWIFFEYQGEKRKIKIK